MQSKSDKINNVESRINEYFEDVYFDFQTMSSTKFPINETQIIKLVTKITVGLATVWISSIELRSIMKSFKNIRS